MNQIKIGVATKDTMPSAFLLRFENGFVLRSNSNVLWTNQEGKQKEKAAFIEVVQALRDKGFEVTGEEKLPNFS